MSLLCIVMAYWVNGHWVIVPAPWGVLAHLQGTAFFYAIVLSENSLPPLSQCLDL